MFNGYRIEAKLKRDRKVHEEPYEAYQRVTPEDIERTAKSVIKYAALGAIGVFAAVVTMNAASEITVHRMTQPKKELES